MDGLTGLSGLQILEEDTPEATAEQRSGGPADPYHGHVGEQSTPYPWQANSTQASGPAFQPPIEGIIEDETSAYYAVLRAGTLDQDPTAEMAPWTHAAPQPKNPIGDGSVQPDNIVRQLVMSAEIHAMKTGGKRNVQIPTMDPVQDDWREIWQVDANSTDLSTVPGQMKSGAAPGGRGHTDRTQSNAHQNSFGFDGRHIHRRYAAGSVPGNYMWMKPGGRRMAKSLAGPARPAVGPGSPFAGDNLGTTFNTDGAILAVPPNQYSPPPMPYYSPTGALPTDQIPPDTSDMYGYGGL